uniref:Uncharacterized protein n=1 Tax=Nelumbo nucifera TaxID=4432 RepID=A0A822Z5F7_NELNU|nr:TPA_asm: hypothetical protein HUJ06_014400 [Nelumbo nucifera]
MAEEKHHHHLFHNHKDERPESEVVYSETTYAADGTGNYSQTTNFAASSAVDYEKEEKQHKHLEHFAREA